MAQSDIPEIIDARGLSCPLPTLKLRRSLENLKLGERLELHATDPMAAIDVPHFCSQNGHLLISQTENSKAGIYPVYIFVIEKAVTF